MKYSLFLLLAVVPACGDNSMTETPAPDAPPAVPMLSIAGTANQRSTSGAIPVEGVTVAAYANTDENTPMATATTDADGKFTLMIETNGVALQGYLKASMAGLVDTYWYPPGPLTNDYMDAGLNMIAPGTLDLLANTLCRANQDLTKGLIAVEIDDASKTPVQGATVSSDPAATTYCYDSGAFPSPTATATDIDGDAFMFNVTGDVTITAEKAGSAFKPFSLKARGGALTTAKIVP
jgi:hypothetical protein